MLALLAAMLPLQDVPQVRTQEVAGRTYVQIRIKAPADLRVPRVQRQAVDKIAPHDLARYPRLVPQDDGASRVAWQVSTGSLEFLGIAGKGGRFKLIYPVETADKPPKLDWKEIDLTIDRSTAVNVPAPGKRNPKAPADDDLEGRWAAAWAREFAVRERFAGTGDALRDARRELCRKYGVVDPLPRISPEPPRDDPAQRTIDIREIAGIEPFEHPWRELLAGRFPPVEQLARVVPAEFWYLRLRVPGAAAAVLERLLRWAGVAVGVWDESPTDHQLRERYLRQLGFRDVRGVRIPDYVREAAFVGSDLHFRMGTDVTALFLIGNEPAYQADRDADRAAARTAHGKRLREESFEHHAVVVTSFSTADGAVRSYRAMIGGLAICSNSPEAVRRVLDVVKRKAPALADTPDFRLMRGALPSEAAGEEVLAYFGESFLREQAGPRHRTLLRRRAAELDRDRAARHLALFRAWDARQPIADPPATFSPPLIERTIDKLSNDEDEAYRVFREHYRSDLEAYVAPFAFRFQGRDGPMRVDAFIATPRRADFWDDMRRKLGKGSVAREAHAFPGTAARLVMSFTPGKLDRARVNRWLIAKGVDKKHLTQQFETLGERVAVHVPDGPALAAVIEHYLHADLTADDLARSRGDGEGRWRLAQVPATLAVAIVKPLFFKGTLKKLQEIVVETWPKLVTWEPLAEEVQRVKLNRVQPAPAVFLLAFGKLLKPEESPGLYFAHNDKTFVAAPSLEALKNGVAREINYTVRREPPERAAAWLALDFGASTHLQTALRTFAERDAHRRALGAASLLQWLHECGVKDDAAARTWLGLVPSGLDGSGLRHDRERGEYVSDRHGSPRQPLLNAKPGAESPWSRTLAEFARVRGELQVRPDGLLGVFVISP